MIQITKRKFENVSTRSFDDLVCMYLYDEFLSLWVLYCTGRLAAKKAASNQVGQGVCSTNVVCTSDLCSLLTLCIVHSGYI